MFVRRVFEWHPAHSCDTHSPTRCGIWTIDFSVYFMRSMFGQEIRMQFAAAGFPKNSAKEWINKRKKKCTGERASEREGGPCERHCDACRNFDDGEQVSWKDIYLSARGRPIAIRRIKILMLWAHEVVCADAYFSRVCVCVALASFNCLNFDRTH